MALRTAVELKPGEEREIIFFLGQAGRFEDVQELLRRYREPNAAARALEEVKKFWDGLLSTIQVRTPNAGMNLLLNRWLLYQVLSLSRLGPHRLLSIQRRLWIPRPIARCDGPGLCRTASGQGAHSAGGGPAIPGR